MMAPDIVYPIRPGKRNEPLRFSLRTLVNVPHRRVFLAGNKPAFCNDEICFIPVRRASNKFADAQNKLLAALECDEVGNEVIVMNDDFFITEPVDQIPPLHLGTIESEIARHNAAGFRWNTRIAGMAATGTWLESLGYCRPLCYEAHVPLPASRHRLATVIRRGSGEVDGVLHLRSAYGNLCGLGGTRIADVKIYDARTAGAGPFVSTCAVSWAGAAGAALRSQFCEPGRYE